MIYSEDFIKWHHWGYLAAAIICAQIENGSLITIQPPNPTVGQNVLLNVEYEGKIIMMNWYKGSGTSDSMLIVTINPETSALTTGKMFTGREKVMNNGSLLISNLRTSDAGDFTVQLSIPGSFTSETAQLTVNVGYGRPPPPIIAVSGGPTQALPVSSYPYLNPTTSESQPKDKVSKPQYNEERRLPSIPPRPYQNEGRSNEEHPYEDLSYIYLSSSYHDLNGPPKT
ncbi:carcinoembryonic antigen-related cell adhesion molecule 16-like isoform X3 [Rana temporaria]|uniref:carcinoembryonic antigen-related cell adhesion molecule 16-like isoform X3 n=1 Tax=Rana temporaria TaxID=8407 RepID=UPI001AAC4865|nr:carcinoembryonic antigen-related cell adhesion molecule 16-like isoform X3 [Rana temporaria]